MVSKNIHRWVAISLKWYLFRCELSSWMRKHTSHLALTHRQGDTTFQRGELANWFFASYAASKFIDNNFAKLYTKYMKNSVVKLRTIMDYLTRNCRSLIPEIAMPCLSIEHNK